MESKIFINGKRSSEIMIPFENIQLGGNLVIPDGATSIVIFSHGSGSSRFSPRNNFVADLLNNENIATLLVDLLTQEEDKNPINRFNIDLLTTRLIAVTQYICKRHDLHDFSVGYFGASTGAASALRAAAAVPDIIDAIVCRGGRSDLAKSILPKITTPTLFIIGSLDEPVIEMNIKAYDLMHCKRKLTLVEGASHLFEEEGKLTEVSNLALNWFQEFL